MYEIFCYYGSMSIKYTSVFHIETAYILQNNRLFDMSNVWITRFRQIRTIPYKIQALLPNSLENEDYILIKVYRE